MSSTLAEITKPCEGDEPDDVLFHSLYGVRLVELNRPAKFNALNASMARKILPRLKVSRGHTLRGGVCEDARKERETVLKEKDL